MRLLMDQRGVSKDAILDGFDEESREHLSSALKGCAQTHDLELAITLSSKIERSSKISDDHTSFHVTLPSWVVDMIRSELPRWKGSYEALSDSILKIIKNK